MRGGYSLREKRRDSMGKKVVHVEFPAQDTDRGEKFWEGLGGWSIEDAGMPGMDYRMFQDDGWGGAVDPGARATQGPVLYLRSRDIDADPAEGPPVGRGAGGKRPSPAVRRVARVKGAEGHPV